MGVLPLEFTNGEDRHTHQLDGSETFDVLGEPAPGAELTLVINRTNGEQAQATVLCRLDTEEELSVYRAGGVLQRFAQDFLESQAA
jgi:aconitate hydratase